MLLGWPARIFDRIYEGLKETGAYSADFGEEGVSNLEEEAFARHARNLTLRNLQFTAVVMGFLTAGTFPTDVILFEIGSPVFTTLFWWRASIISSCVITLLLIRSFPWCRNHPDWLGVVSFSLPVLASGYLVGSYGGLESPLTYGIYTTPFLTVLLITPLGFRIAATMNLVILFGLAFFLPHPDYLNHPLAGAPPVWMTGVVATTVGIGHVVYHLLRINFLQRFALNRIVARQTEELRQRADALLSIQEENRKRIGQDIHDELGQLLTGLRMEMDRLRLVSQNPNTAPAKQDQILQRSESLLNAVHDSLEGILNNLFPLSLETEGLNQTLQRMIHEMNHHLKADYHADSQVNLLSLSREQALVLYRIIQESLTNVIKHAQAANVDVTLSLEQEENEIPMLHFTIRDDGQGFEVEQPSRPGAFGLAGLYERAKWLDGHLHITSAPGKGTTIQGRIPIGRNSEEQNHD